MATDSIRVLASPTRTDQFDWLRALQFQSQQLDLPPNDRLINVLSAAVPPGTESTSVSASKLPNALTEAGVQVLHFNFEEAHSGRLTVFGTAGGSVGLTDVFGSFDASALMHLFGYGDNDNGELVFFTPGLNTWHQPRLPNEVITPERHVHYSNILGGLRMINMNMGTSADQESLMVDSRLATFLSEQLPDEIAATRVGDDFELNSRMFDLLQTLASEAHIIDHPVKQNYRRLFGARVPVVLMCYSRASVEVAAALREFMRDEVASGREQADVEAQLFEYVTVVTIGNASPSYIDGPRYIHLANAYDPLTRFRGVTPDSQRRTAAGGRDAVFLRCPSTPYALNAFDNHNFASFDGQYLSLVLHLNRIQSFRELHQHIANGRFVQPTDEEVRAMIMFTRGQDWLWSPEDAWRNTSPNALPTDEHARRILARRCESSWLRNIDELIKSPNNESYAANH